MHLKMWRQVIEIYTRGIAKAFKLPMTEFIVHSYTLIPF